MAMMVPMRRNRNLLSELMTDPFDAFFNAASAPMQAMQKMSPTLMCTDIKETDGGYELTIDLPGFKKDDVQAELKDGYLTINAQTQGESEDKDEQGTYVRKERFSGKCSRTFYVGDDVEEDDIEKLIPTLKENKGEPFGSFKKLTMDDAREIYRIAL